MTTANNERKIFLAAAAAAVLGAGAYYYFSGKYQTFPQTEKLRNVHLKQNAICTRIEAEKDHAKLSNTLPSINPLAHNDRETDPVLEDYVPEVHLGVSSTIPTAETSIPQIIVPQLPHVGTCPQQEKEDESHVSVMKSEGLWKVTENEPILLRQVIRPIEIDEIQEIVHRDREQTEFIHITQPVVERQVKEAQVIDREEVAIHKHDVELNSHMQEELEEIQKEYSNVSVQYQDTKKVKIIKPPIIEEVVRKNIVEVIQPVIYREVIEPVIVHVKQPVYEVVKDCPQVHHEQRQVILKDVAREHWPLDIQPHLDDKVLSAMRVEAESAIHSEAFIKSK